MNSESTGEGAQQEVDLASHEERQDHDHAYYAWFGLSLATSFAAAFTHGNQRGPCESRMDGDRARIYPVAGLERAQRA